MNWETDQKIAEIVGWYGLRKSGRLDGQFVGYSPKRAIMGEPGEIPHYSEDLNAMAEAEKNLDGNERLSYSELVSVFSPASAKAQAFLTVKTKRNEHLHQSNPRI